MQPAPEGTGIIAGGADARRVRRDGRDQRRRQGHGSTNPYNIVRATIDGSKRSTTPAEVAAKRGKSVEEINWGLPRSGEPWLTRNPQGQRSSRACRHAQSHRATVRGLGLRKLNSTRCWRTRRRCAA
jgi:hypothetical protein